MCYVHNQWYDISCATLYLYTLSDNKRFTEHNVFYDNKQHTICGSISKGL